MYTYGPLLITCYCASLWCMYWPLVCLQRKILLFIQVSEIAYSVAQKHYKIFDFIHWIWAVQPLEQRMLTAFSQCSLISMCKHACMLPVYTFWAHCTSLSLFRQCFFVIPPLRVYMNLRSMFPSLNVVTAGLNRMQVGCNISLSRRYTGWPECVVALISLYSGCLDNASLRSISLHCRWSCSECYTKP